MLRAPAYDGYETTNLRGGRCANEAPSRAPIQRDMTPAEAIRFATRRNHHFAAGNWEARRDGVSRAAMNDPTMKQALYWSSHIARNSPSIAGVSVRLAIRCRANPIPEVRTILVGTHHKVLTVFLGRVFRIFARITGRTVSQSRGDLLDYNADVLLDTHSEFIFDRVREPWDGLHVIRDPRDIVVSAANYHLSAHEKWLLVPRDEFDGRTYQEQICSIGSMEERLLFELDHSAGSNIRDMLAWNYSRPGIAEVRYEELVGAGGRETFAEALASWSLTRLERRVLIDLFSYFSVGNPGASNNSHIRNAGSNQWKRHFTPSVHERFEELFPGALDALGYAADR